MTLRVNSRSSSADFAAASTAARGLERHDVGGKAGAKAAAVPTRAARMAIFMMAVLDIVRGISVYGGEEVRVKVLGEI